MTDERTHADPGVVRRDRMIWTTLVVLGALVAAGVLALSWGVIEGRLNAAKQLDRAVALLKGTDATVTAADEVIRADLGPEMAAKAADVATRVETARTQLAEANTLSVAGFDRLTDDEQEQALLLQQATQARLDMLGSAAAVLSATERAASAEGLASQAWIKTHVAEELALQSVADYDAATKADVRNAVVANREANAGFAAARDLISQAASTFPEAKLDAFVAYIDTRLALAALSTKAHDAWLAGSSVQANKLRASYIKENDVAAGALKQLPGSPTAAVTGAYKAMTDTPSSAYYKARQKAAEADEALESL